MTVCDQSLFLGSFEGAWVSFYRQERCGQPGSHALSLGSDCVAKGWKQCSGADCRERDQVG